MVANNTAAQSRLIRTGDNVRQIVTEEHWDTYTGFSSGALFLTITVGGIPCPASITRTKDGDIFVLETDSDAQQLQALALAAQQLRTPLSNAMIVADDLLAELKTATAAAQQQTAQLQRGLFQLLRIISNMSDSGHYQETIIAGKEMTNITGLFRDIMEKAQIACQNAGMQLAYTEPKEVILSVASPERLERAIYNILSNAMRFSPAGSTVDAKLSCNGSQISFTVSNLCTEPVQDHPFWNRYRREPAIEDSRHGLGLGMTLISATAAAHGGTVLIDHPDDKTTRVTMTLAVVIDDSNTVRSPILRIGDYAGGRDKALLEFADLLSTDAFKNI